MKYDDLYDKLFPIITTVLVIITYIFKECTL